MAVSSYYSINKQQGDAQMPDKIITQRAEGYGGAPVTVTVQIDGATVLQGTVPTLDQPPPALPSFWTPELGENAWSWTVDSNFDGTQIMTVSVDNGALNLYDTFYTLSDQPGNVYSLMYSQVQEQGNVAFTDPFTQVSINGVAQNPVREPEQGGQWVWQLSAGDVLTCTVNIEAPPVPPPPVEPDPE